MAKDHSAVIGSGIEIKGGIVGDVDLDVFGKVNGTVKLSAELFIQQGGMVVGDVNADFFTIHGNYDGNANGNQKIHLAEGCLVAGSLKAPVITIEEGSTFNGVIEMDVEISEE